jgi:hypothetical protein
LESLKKLGAYHDNLLASPASSQSLRAVRAQYSSRRFARGLMRSPRRRIVVKYVDRYGERAYRLLANHEWSLILEEDLSALDVLHSHGLVFGLEYFRTWSRKKGNDDPLLNVGGQLR